MPYVERDAELTVTGKYARLQPGIAEEWLDDGHPDLEPSTEQLASAARADRDKLLLDSDPTQLPDAPLTDSEQTAWADYRQALRDVPEQAGFPDTIDWPPVP